MKHLVFQPFPALKTARLLLRALESDDAAFIYKLRTSKENARYLDLPLPQGLKDWQAYITKQQQGTAEIKFIYWAIERKADHQMIGSICLWNFNLESERAELGYELHLSAQKHGYMTEALEAVMAYASETLGIRKLQAFTHENNAASSRLLEKQQFRLVAYRDEIHSKTKRPYRYAIFSRILLNLQ